MTAARIQQLREFIAGRGTCNIDGAQFIVGGNFPREHVIMQSKELLALLALADAQIRRPQLGLSRQGDRYRNGVPKI